MTRPTTARLPRWILGLALCLAATTLVVQQASAATGGDQLCGPSGGQSDQISVTGWVNQDRQLDKAALDALPQRTVADTFLAGSGSSSANYTGVDLARILELPIDGSGIGTLLKPSAPPGPQTPVQRNDLTRYSVMVTGSDCFQALFAMTEISPFFGGKPVLVATAQGPFDPTDLTPVTGPLGSSGFARISNPVDVRGSRRVSNIVEIRVLQAPANTTTAPAQSPICAGGPTSSLTVSGQVTSPRTYDATALAALPQTTVADTYLAGSGSTSRNYTGVDLWRLLGLSEGSASVGSLILPNGPGPQAPAPQRNDLTRYSVMVTASDCFQALFSLAEISPFFGGRPVLVATAQGPYDPSDLTPETGSLGTDGFARISIPTDQRGSRRVSNIVDIRVLPSPTPTIVWPSPAPISVGTPLGAAQLDARASLAGAGVPGVVTYDPPIGTVLGVGEHELTALFVPTSPSSVTIARATTTITVLPSTPPPPPAATTPVVTTTTLVASGKAQVRGAERRVRLRVAVSPPSAAVGKVTFLDGRRVVRTKSLDSRGWVSIRVPARTKIGVHRFRARFSGNAGALASASGSVKIVVIRR